MDKKKGIVAIVLLLLLAVLAVSFFCDFWKPKYTYFKPTDEFYIGDNANALTQGTKWTIYLNSDALYENSLNYEVTDTMKGAQVVVVTYSATDYPAFDSTVLFNEWGIGKNDMGVLIAVSFLEDENGLTYQDTIFNIGASMMGYFSAFEASQIITDAQSSYTDFELRLGMIYFETLSAVYDHVYGVNFTYDMSVLADDMLYETDPLPSEQVYFGSWLEAIFVGTIPSWLKIVLLAGLFLGLSGFIGFGISSKHSGGGGSSVGYWFKRK